MNWLLRRRLPPVPPLVLDDGGASSAEDASRAAVEDSARIHHWIDGGPTNYANLAVLCGRHHRAHHAGTYTVSYDKTAPGQFRFHLPYGTAIERAPQPLPLTGDITDHHPAPITADTIQPAWPGDPLHLDYAVMVMTQTRAA